jgi:tyrosyl-tRNA synthetase
MFGKIMAWTDSMIVGGFELCTDISKEEILQIEVAMQNDENPMQYKKRLAREIITTYHNEAEAVRAQENWEKTFSGGGIPETLQEVVGQTGALLVDVLLLETVIDSKSDFRRLVEEGAVKIMHETSEEKISDPKYSIQETVIVKLGKKKFIKIVI